MSAAMNVNISLSECIFSGASPGLFEAASREVGVENDP